jgi:hypothetical protein
MHQELETLHNFCICWHLVVIILSYKFIRGSICTVQIMWSWYSLFFRETTDTYTIAASPIFGYLGPSTSKYSLLDLGRSGLGSDLKLPLVSDKADGKQDSVKNLPKTLSSIRDERVSFQLQHTGEIYISQGCSVTQTVFNGTIIWIQKCSTYLLYWTCLIHISFR